MKWITLQEQRPHDWNWVIVGYKNDQESIVYQIARWNPVDNVFEMWNMDTEYGPTEADAFWEIKPKQITHWFEVTQDLKQ